ncbi:MAG: C40 family peptidase [Robiginitomaculum sp.]|nr:C40 family peptidase [Robiginitomaculum sp.]
MNRPVTRLAVCQEALEWIGTPYRHQASTKAAGCDCLGLVRGIWRKFYGDEPLNMPPYTPNWAEKGGAEILKNTADQYLCPVSLAKSKPADVLLFRMQAGVPAKHMAILLKDDLIIHAYWGRAVTKSYLAPFWQKRRAYAYSFPQISGENYV